MAVVTKLLARPGPRPLKTTRIQAPLHARPLFSTFRAAVSYEPSQPVKMSKTALRKQHKVTLESTLRQHGLDSTGNKDVLLERIMAASQQITIQVPMPAASKVQEEPFEEVGILRTKLARLQQEFAALTQQLEAASAAAEAERVQLEKLGSAMASMQAEREEERAQLQAAVAAAAQQLQQSSEENESLRAMVAYKPEYMRIMQGLLEEKDSVIELLKSQREEFAVKETAYAVVAAGVEGDVAVAERPASADWDIPSSWRPSAATLPSLAGGVPFVMEDESQGRVVKQVAVTQKHGAPMMLAIAGGQVATDAYMAVRSKLPKGFCYVMDFSATAVGCTLLAMAAYA